MTRTASISRIALITAALLCAAPAFSADVSPAALAGARCDANAIDKNGKPLAGAAKDGFLKRCYREAGLTAECEAKALSKDGKPLAGAARDASVGRCQRDAVQALGCEARAVSKDGKPLAGAAKDSSIRRCEDDAKAAAAAK